MLTPLITINGKPYRWATALPDNVRVALFNASTAGKSIKRFIAMPNDLAHYALTIARLDRETGSVYAEPLLKELAPSRVQIGDASTKLAA